MKAELFLVDTSAWILALRKSYLPVVKDRIDHLLKEDTVLTTGIIKLELLGGVKTQKEFNRLKSRLDVLEEVQMDESLLNSAYTFAFDLRRAGLTIPSTDILIAACAMEAQAILIHADAHFDLIAGQFPLCVESFVQAYHPV